MKPTQRAIAPLLAVFCALAGTANAAPLLSIEDRTIRVSGVAPGATVVVFGVTQETQGYMLRTEQVAELLDDADKDGVVVLQRPASIPFHSVWTAVDLPSGHTASATGNGTDVRTASPGRGALHRGRSGKVDAFTFRAHRLELLYVHSGRVWTWSEVDGTDDGEAADGQVIAFGGRGKSLGKSESPPAEFAPGGTLVAIDPSTLEVTLRRLDASTLDGVR